MADEVMTKKNIYLVSDVDKARELEAYIVSTKDVWKSLDLLVVMNLRN